MSELKACPCCMNKTLKERVMVVDDCVNCGTQIRKGSDITISKIIADTVREFLCENAPMFDDEGLDPEVHHCEFTLREERKRLFGLINKLERGKV
jgi:hypothetical protein